MSTPLVSIIVPAYNAGAFIGKAIRSVCSQTYSHWELLVVNDGSRDDTGNVVRSFLQDDPRIRYFEQENKGVSAARNMALDNVRGSWIFFLDADDELPPQSIEKQVAYVNANPDCNMLAGLVKVVDQENPPAVLRTWQARFRGNPLSAFVRLEERVFFGCMMFIAASLTRTVRFKEALTHAEDVHYVISLSLSGNVHYDSFGAHVYTYCSSGSSAMSRLDLLEKGYWQLLASVKEMPEVNAEDKKYLRNRIIRIMTLTYISRFRFADALRVFVLKRFAV